MVCDSMLAKGAKSDRKEIKPITENCREGMKGLCDVETCLSSCLEWISLFRRNFSSVSCSQ
jgi:hypothetical protein